LTRPLITSLIEDDGNLVRGAHSIADNVSTTDGRYAAHTRGCNTGFDNQRNDLLH